MKKVIYSYFVNDERSYFVNYLKENHDWEPVFFHGIEGMREWVDECHPDAVLQDAMKMRRGHFDYSQIGRPVPIDKTIINNLSVYYSSYMNWLEDTTGWNFSYSERRQYYYDVLKYWNTVINNLKPDIFIAYTWPHLASDYPLYLLCKHCYSIPVLFLDIIPYFDGNNRVVGHSMEDASLIFKSTYYSKKELKISDPVLKYLSQQRSKKAISPTYVTNEWERIKDSSVGNWNWLKILKTFLSPSSYKKANIAFKKNKESLDSEKSTNFITLPSSKCNFL